MTSRQRSAVIGVSVMVVVGLAAVAAVVRPWDGGDGGGGLGDGQFIENAVSDTSGGIGSVGGDGGSVDGVPAVIGRSGDGTEGESGTADAVDSSDSSDDGAEAAGDADGAGDSDESTPVVKLPSSSGEVSPPDSSSTTSSSTTSTTSTTEAPTTSSSTSTSTTSSSSSTSTSTTSTTAAPTSSSSSSSSTTSTTVAAGGLHAVEREIARLTNELRANPSGSLAREKPMPSCVTNGNYGITVDPGTGHPSPVPALSLSEPVSLQLARTWSQEMDAAGVMSHRPFDEQSAIYSQLGISWSTIGENVAWFSGYPDSQAAMVFFRGWRESDTGHYCALVSGSFTHFGVGYHKGASRSWATQNFYRPR